MSNNMRVNVHARAKGTKQRRGEFDGAKLKANAGISGSNQAEWGPQDR